MMGRGVLIAVVAVAVAVIGWALFSTWSAIVGVGANALHALWTLPAIIAIHLFQLLLSSFAWRGLFAAPPPPIANCFRLRLIREGIDSLFPVAQIGGEVIAARMMAQRGMPVATAGASVIVDVSLEFLAQAGFLLTGIGVLALLAGTGTSADWFGSFLLAGLAAAGFLIAQRFGLLRLLEILTSHIAQRFPNLGSLSLSGLHAAAAGFYRRRANLLRGTLLHFISWSFGTAETWVILRALGSPVSLPQALVIESLGMAARTAGFAIPGALAVQEGGFALAALSVGVPDTAGLSLSLVKRAREIVVGTAGVLLARWGN